MRLRTNYFIIFALMNSKSILIVAATELEVKPLLAALSQYKQSGMGPAFLINDTIVEILITGVGVTPSTFFLTRALSRKKYEVAVNLGIAGTFDKNMALGTVVNVTEEAFADLGVMNQDGFMPLKDVKGLPASACTQFVTNSYPYAAAGIDELKKCRGITVSTVSGTEEVIERYYNLYRPDTESMEGAAFLYVCGQMEQAALQIRAISNHVTARNKSKWQITKATENLATVFLENFLGL